MPIKKLRKAVISTYKREALKGGAVPEDVRKVFRRNLKNTEGVSKKAGIVRLA